MLHKRKILMTIDKPSVWREKNGTEIPKERKVENNKKIEIFTGRLQRSHNHEWWDRDIHN